MIGQPQQYPELPAKLARNLAKIVPSRTDCCTYYPVKVKLKNGMWRDKIYLVGANEWIVQWGIWPDEDRGKNEVLITDIIQLADSPSRLPAQYATALYQEGESGMGYTVFTVKFRDGSDMAVVTGNALDFIDYPLGQNPDTVVGVRAHDGRDGRSLSNGPEYAWCLFGGAPSSNSPDA